MFNMLIYGQFSGLSQTFQEAGKQVSAFALCVYVLSQCPLSLLCTELAAISCHSSWDCFQIAETIAVSCSLKVKRLHLEVSTSFPIGVFREIEMRNQFSSESSLGLPVKGMVCRWGQQETGQACFSLGSHSFNTNKQLFFFHQACAFDTHCLPYLADFPEDFAVTAWNTVLVCRAR